jgi:hypothetical protein
MKVQMRRIGTDQPVVAKNPLKRWRSEGVELSSFGQWVNYWKVEGTLGQNKPHNAAG